MGDGKRDALKRLLALEREPAALRWCTRIPDDIPRLEEKERFCVKLDRATRGESFYATADEEACMGGARYCGMRDPATFGAGRRSGEFLVGMGIYRDVAAVQRAWLGNRSIEPDIFAALAFAPLSGAPFEPDVVIVLCNARQAMELLHANAYVSGRRGIGADAGPICSSMAATTYLTGKITYGFADIGSRRSMELGDDVAMVGIPGCELRRIEESLAEMLERNAFRA